MNRDRLTAHECFHGAPREGQGQNCPHLRRLYFAPSMERCEDCGALVAAPASSGASEAVLNGQRICIYCHRRLADGKVHVQLDGEACCIEAASLDDGLPDTESTPETLANLLAFCRAHGKDWDRHPRDSYARGYAAACNAIAGRLAAMIDQSLIPCERHRSERGLARAYECIICEVEALNDKLEAREAPLVPPVAEVIAEIELALNADEFTMPNTSARMCPSCLNYANEGHAENCNVKQVRIALRHCLTLLRALPGPDGWQPISTAPKDGTKVFVWDGFDAMTAFFVTESYGWHSADAMCAEEPTHWMPLLAPPAER